MDACEFGEFGDEFSIGLPGESVTRLGFFWLRFGWRAWHKKGGFKAGEEAVRPQQVESTGGLGVSRWQAPFDQSVLNPKGPRVVKAGFSNCPGSFARETPRLGASALIIFQSYSVRLILNRLLRKWSVAWGGFRMTSVWKDRQTGAMAVRSQ
jgi:hypothetical protein